MFHQTSLVTSFNEEVCFVRICAKGLFHLPHGYQDPCITNESINMQRQAKLTCWTMNAVSKKYANLLYWI